MYIFKQSRPDGIAQKMRNTPETACVFLRTANTNGPNAHIFDKSKSVRLPRAAYKFVHSNEQAAYEGFADSSGGG